MSIRRGKHSSNYTQMPNQTLSDERLSFEARGVLGYLLSKPENWIIQIKDICRNGNIGRDKAYRILKELQETGYLERDQQRAESGQMGAAETVVHDLPQSPVPENAETAEPFPENPTLTKDIESTKDRTYTKGDEDKEILKEAVSEYRSIAKQIGLSDIRGLTKERESHLKARIHEHGIEVWRAAMRSIPLSDHLSKPNPNSKYPNWRPTFDWFVNPNNFLKVIEGKYNNGKAVTADAEPDLLTRPAAPAFEDTDKAGWEHRFHSAYEGIWLPSWSGSPGTKDYRGPKDIEAKWAERLGISTAGGTEKAMA